MFNVELYLKVMSLVILCQIISHFIRSGSLPDLISYSKSGDYDIHIRANY